jgi:hypothetical protein
LLEVISIAGSHDFKLVRDGIDVCTLIKKGWLKSSAETEVNGEKIEIRATSIFCYNYDIIKNGKLCGRIKTSLTGATKVELKRSDGNGSDVFDLKREGWLIRDYRLRAKGRQEILMFRGKFGWSDFRAHYEIIEQDHGYPDEAINELLIYGTFAMKVHIHQSS